MQGPHEEDHERIRVLLATLRTAWRTGQAARVRRQLQRIESLVSRHLLWEEHDLVDPIRQRITLLHQHQVIQRDGQVHRDLRVVLAGIRALLPQRTPGGLDTDRRILEQVDELEKLLDLHRTVFEAQVRSAVDAFHSPEGDQRSTSDIAAEAPPMMKSRAPSAPAATPAPRGRISSTARAGFVGS